MSKTHRHSQKLAIPQILLDEEARLKAQGLKFKGPELNYDGPNKLSEAIKSLIRPYKDMASSYTAFSGLVAIACAAWNASLVEEPERDEMVKKAANLFKDKTDAKGLLEFNQFFYELIERKLLLFPNDWRYVVNFKVTETKSTFNIFVVSLEKSK